MDRNPQDLLPLTPAILHILLALAGSEMHGYGLMQAITTLSNGVVRVGPGTLYRSIKLLLEEGLIEESDERPDPALDDERRRYYRLTEWGLRVLQAEIQRLERLVNTAHCYRPVGDTL